MALHTFFFTAPEELARPPVGLEFNDLPTGPQASLPCMCLYFLLARPSGCCRSQPGHRL